MFLCTDDVVVMRELLEKLQEPLDVVTGYVRDFGVRISSVRSQIMLINGADERNRT